MIAVVASASTLLLACSGDDSDGSASADGGASGSRDVEHARGVSNVPDEPEQIVVLEPVQLDTAVALDVVPVGTTVLSEETGVPGYLGDEAAAIEMVGTVPEPDIEEIASLEPDLIIGTETRHSALYDQLSDIAPTVFMPSQADPWPENVRLVGDALNKADEAEALLEEYQARCDDIAAEFDVEGRTAQLIRPRDGVLSLYGPTSFAGSTLECAGFSTPEHDWEDISVDVSPERVLQATADLVLVTAVDPDDPNAVPESITGNASSFENLHVVDQSFWITGVGPLGGQTVLDDLERILRETTW
ncbi:iron-siderophore ABC transporter substrate-binding protein [Phytoactinopolyspora halotolerans]|uniref:Iron-siderophore ABC transporter substrate-binding protein n=1 Tax=Phytoactinopolyspora halotolerans TaxID=1981512 RepID=A0A6L9S7H2_9ACTN|nr:iron-siderophore ABC transporter substrate-binding protein [Phytoactinopolyspora halotolerans]